jgi:CYTH domain-containing protein
MGVAMPVEIERKFLVANDGWRGQVPGQRYCQGYLSKGDVTVRVRRAGPRAFLTINGSGNGIVRPEGCEDLLPEGAQDSGTGP